MAKQTIPNSGLWSSIAGLLNSNYTELYDNQAGQYVEAARYSSTVTQLHTTTDTPIVVTYGAGGTDAQGISTMGADGVTTVNKNGPAFIKVHYRVGRTGSSGTSRVVLKGQYSIDGGTTWLPSGTDTFSATLDSSSDVNIINEVSFLVGVAGFKFRTVWARDSSGTNAGDLVPLTPSAALQAEGFTIEPSARIVLYYDQDYNYG